METITINIHELNKLLQEKVKTNPFFTYHLSKELLEEVKALNMHIVSRQFKDKEAKTFIEWYLSEGYIPTERTGVYKNGCNIVLGEDLYLKYTEAIKVKP
jgi:hypothetical protein